MIRADLNDVKHTMTFEAGYHDASARRAGIAWYLCCEVRGAQSDPSALHQWIVLA